MADDSTTPDLVSRVDVTKKRVGTRNVLPVVLWRFQGQLHES